MRRWPLAMLLILAMLSMTQVPYAWSQHTGTVSLRWDPPTTNTDDTPLEDLAGFRLYYRLETSSDDTMVDVGMVTSYTLTSLEAGMRYAVVATAYDTSDNESQDSNEVISVAQTPTQPPYQQRVNAGGKAYTDGAGQVWGADQAYQAGSWGHSGGRTYSTKDAIANTTNDPLYQTERYGNVTYRFDLPNGGYQVILHAAEIYHKSAGRRLFDVSLEGALVLDNVDIYAAVGHDAAMSSTFDVDVSDGQLTIEFRTERDNAKISAIEVMNR